MEHLDDVCARQPLTATQQSFWALSEIFPESPVGNEGLCLRLRGELDRGALLRSIAELARRCDAWRSTIEIDPADPAGTPVAYVRSFEPFPVETVDLCALAAAEREAALREALSERLQRRFDLKQGPAMRVTLLRCAADLHVLLFVSHHVAFDALSLFEILPRTLAELYGAFHRGESPELPAPVSFAEFARAQHERSQAPEGPDVAFWRETLAGASGAIDLPADHPRPLRRGWRGLRERVVLSTELKERLAARARALHVSLSDVLLAAWVALLHRYSAVTDLLVGIPHGNRADVRLAVLFGLLMLTVPVRFDLRGPLTFRDLVMRVRGSKRSAFEHLDPRIDEILREQVSSHEGEAPSGYRVVFNYARLALDAVGLEGLEVSAERPDPGWTAVDLSLDLSDGGAGLAATLEVARDLFDAPTARRCLGHYVNLLEAIASGADGLISRLPLLGADEREALLAAGSAARLAYPRERCLHEVLAERAAAAPSAPAASCGGRELGRAELHAQARRLAAHLRALGAKPGERVALVLEDPLASLVAVLGALESGAAYVPIDASLPPARMLWMLEAARPVAIVSQRALASTLRGVRTPLLHVDALPAGPAPAVSAEPVPPSAEDAAYVVFTSGSTGSPKGVVVRHRNVVSQLFARLDGYRERPTRLLTAHSFAFDAAYAGIFWALAAGATLVLPDADERRDPIALRRLIAQHRVSHLDVPPALYQELLASESAEELRSLAAVIVGGEVCTAALARAHGARLPWARLFNEYGPTETTIYSTVYELPREPVDDPVPIGRPIANTRCYVLDENRELVPQGVAGELYIGGDGVAAGYLDQPELSAKRFVDDPFARAPGETMYRTGDRVRLRADGELEFLGRVDRQRKIRGNRVELAEIEAALRRCPHVRASVVVPRDAAPDSELDAFVVLARRQAGSLAEVRAALLEQVPRYMVPARFAAVEAVPLSAAGKVDVERLRALATPVAIAELRERPYVEPRTQLELELAALWRDLLGHARIDVHDDFTDLGGHSLLALRMLSRVVDLVGVRVPLATFVRCPTIASLASLIHQNGGIAEEPLVVPIQPKGARPPFWLIHPVGGHVVFAKRLASHLDPNQPLLGIQAQGLDGHREPLRTIEEMADRYVELILETQPDGPYLVGGYSMGGSIALEIARRLRDAGRTPALVALLDAPGPNYPRRLSLPLRALDRLRFALKPGWRRRASEATLEDPSEYFSYPIAEMLKRQDGPPDPIEAVTHANALAAERYQPRFYGGAIHVFRALRTPEWPGNRFDDPLCGWGPFASSIEVVPIDCYHQNMMDEPAVTEVGRRLDALLAAAPLRTA